jgi:hypothetical protein
MMKTFKIRAAQGEIQIRRIGNVGASFPPATDMNAEKGKMVIGHSETGHHHVLERKASVCIAKTAPPGMKILYAILTEPNALIHERDFDTHDPIALAPGVYEFRITREFDPYAQLARQQAD